MEATKYKIMSSIGDGKEFMNGMVLDFVLEDDAIGKEVNCLGSTFKITQNGQVLVLANKDWVVSLMEQPKPEVKVDDQILPNREYDIFFETKTFRINNTSVSRKGISYEKFFETIRDEWKTVEKLRTDPFPMKYNPDFKSLIFTHGWSWDSDDFKYLKEGSWGREDKDGRSI